MYTVAVDRGYLYVYHKYKCYSMYCIFLLQNTLSSATITQYKINVIGCVFFIAAASLDREHDLSGVNRYECDVTLSGVQKFPPVVVF